MGDSTTDAVDKTKAGDDRFRNDSDLTEAWIHPSEQLCNPVEKEVSFSDMDTAAITKLGGALPWQCRGKVGPEIARLLNILEYPAFLVMSNGLVVSSNHSARKRFDLRGEVFVSHLPVQLEGNACLEHLIANAIQGVEIKDESEQIITRAVTTDIEHPVMLSISSAPGISAHALVIIVKIEWEGQSLFRNQFNLTKAEVDVLEGVVHGFSSKEIAIKRRRSNETIRAQIQSLREKAGAKTQTDLVRAALTLCVFEHDVKKLALIAGHPRRRQAEILCKGGRKVELTIMGDFSGEPVLCIANGVNYTFAVNVENALYDRGLYMISVCTPGCGKTDLPPAGMSRQECLARDVKSVLKQLEIEKTLFMAYNANVALCYTLANQIPESIYHLAHIAAPVPPRYMKILDARSVWVEKLLRKAGSDAIVTRHLLKGALNSLAAHGAEQYFNRYLSATSAELEVVFNPDNLREFDHAVTIATQCGSDAAAEDIACIFADWTSQAHSLPVEITIVHGLEDSLSNVNNVRNFFQEFSGKASMIEVPDAGFALLQSSPCMVAGYLRDMVDNYGGN